MQEAESQIRLSVGGEAPLTVTSYPAQLNVLNQPISALLAETHSSVSKCFGSAVCPKIKGKRGRIFCFVIENLWCLIIDTNDSNLRDCSSTNHSQKYLIAAVVETRGVTTWTGHFFAVLIS